MKKRACSLQLIAGWCALLVYAGAASPLGIGVAALFGSVDTNHRLRVNLETHGLQIVLHHRPACAAHHHGAVARALILFAQPASAANPDHVLQFTAPGTSSKPDQFKAPTPASCDPPAFACIQLDPSDSCGAATSSVSPRPPLDAGANLLLIYSKVLLI